MSLRTEPQSKGIVINDSGASGSASSSTPKIKTPPLIERPTARETLRFGRMNSSDTKEMEKLVAMYDAAWCNEDLLRKQGFSEAEIERARGLKINIDILKAQYTAFPDGQIVGRLTKDDGIVPVSMLSTFVMAIQRPQDILPGYANVTSNRTFARHVDPKSIADGQTGLLFCVSIITDPQFQGKIFALNTLTYGIGLAASRGLAAVSYSAPRGFGAYRRRFPEIEIMTYLHTTKPIKDEDHDLAKSSQRYTRRLAELNEADTAKIYSKKLEPLPVDLFFAEAYAPEGFSAYSEFRSRYGNWCKQQYGHELTIVDYIRLSGRQHVDPVMNMHIQFGADFIYDQDGRITCVFRNSRPEDVSADGYNVALTYHHRSIFTGQQQ